MRIRLCRSFHSPELRTVVREAWQNDELAILCPPHTAGLDFCRYLPEGEIELVGDWQGLAVKTIRDEPEYPERPVLGVFTSGTESGKQRLVLYTKKNINASLDAIMELFDVSRIEQIFCYAQPFHTFGLLLGYVLSLKLGCELITPDGKYSANSHSRRLALRNPNLLTLGTPAHFFDLIDTVKKSGASIAPSYSCIMGGAAVSVELWQQAQSLLQIEAPSIGYGCTEASPGITHLAPGRAPKEDSEIGILLPNLVTELAPGYVSIRGPSLCLGVIENDGLDLSKVRQIRDSLVKRDDGILVYQGRTDLVINRGGQKIGLESIERAIYLSLAIEALCVPVADRRLGQDLGILIKSDDSNIIEEVRKVLLEQFRVQLRSELCLLVDDFPRGATAKPNRQAAASHLSGSMEL